MPMKPSGGESQNDFVSRCTSEMADKHPDWDNDRRVAACFSMYRENKAASLWAGIKKAIKSFIDLR